MAKSARVPAVSHGASKTPDVTREFAQHAQPKRATNVAGVASGRDAKRRTSQAFSGGDERDRPAGRGRVRGDNAHPAYLRARGHGMAPALLPALLGRSLRCRDGLGTTSGGCPPSARVAPPRGGWMMSRWTRVPRAGDREGRGRGRSPSEVCRGKNAYSSMIEPALVRHNRYCFRRRRNPTYMRTIRSSRYYGRSYICEVPD